MPDSVRKRQTNPKKFYVIDHGLHNFLNLGFSRNKGRLLENVVFLELKRRHAHLSYYKTQSGREIDFLSSRNGKEQLIQVCYDMQHMETADREKRAILNDVETGRPLAAMEGGLITAMRTAAVSAVATRHLAKPGTSVVGIIGAGMQGRYHLSALRKVMPEITTTHVFDIHQPTLDDYVHRFREMMPFEINPAASIEAVIKNSDIVVTATGKLDQILYRAKWIGTGALVLPVHMFGWDRAAITESDKFIVDDWDQFRSYMALHGQNYLPLPQPDAELGEIVIRAKNGRMHASERIINFNLGLALHDIAIANHIFTRAKYSGMGTHVTLMRELPPFVM